MTFLYLLFLFFSLLDFIISLVVEFEIEIDSLRVVLYGDKFAFLLSLWCFSLLFVIVL